MDTNVNVHCTSYSTLHRLHVEWTNIHQKQMASGVQQYLKNKYLLIFYVCALILNEWANGVRLAQSLTARRVVRNSCGRGTRCRISSVTRQPTRGRKRQNIIETCEWVSACGYGYIVANAKHAEAAQLKTPLHPSTTAVTVRATAVKGGEQQLQLGRVWGATREPSRTYRWCCARTSRRDRRAALRRAPLADRAARARDRGSVARTSDRSNSNECKYRTCIHICCIPEPQAPIWKQLISDLK